MKFISQIEKRTLSIPLIVLLSSYLLIAAYSSPVFAAEPAIVDVHPNTINKQTPGQFITVYIEFDATACPECDVRDIDVSTVTLQIIEPVTSVQLHVATGSPTEVGDGNDNGVLDRMVKFDRASIQAAIPDGTSQVTFKVSGQFFDGQPFEGTDIVAVKD